MPRAELISLSDIVEFLKEDFAVTPIWDARLTLIIWRLGQAGHHLRTPFGFALRRLHAALDALWTRGYIGAELPRSVRVGSGLLLKHAGRQVIIHPATRMGAGVTLYHGVTIGVNGSGIAPEIEDGVYLGAKSTVLGAITVGAGARVGAGAVVLHDVAENATVVGVPARPAH